MLRDPKEGKPRGRNAAGLQGTCSGFNVQGFQDGALMHPIQSNHVGGVGTEPGDAQAQGSARQGEVPGLCGVVPVRYLKDKAVEVAPHRGPGGREAVPRYVRDGEVRQRGLRRLCWTERSERVSRGGTVNSSEGLGHRSSGRFEDIQHLKAIRGKFSIVKI